MKLAGIFLAGVFLSSATAAAPYEGNWESLDRRPTPQWWCDAKFGIFIHWGLYAVPAYAPKDAKSIDICYSEHYHHRMLQQKKPFLDFNDAYNDGRAYGDFIKDFRAEHFDAGKWADLFRRAGAKYAVLTSKHHDGFALWPSAASAHWNSVDAGPKRDVCREFVTAMRQAGLRAGFYYSHLEYGNPMYENAKTRGKFIDYVNLTQLKELAEDYGADIIWPDGEWFDSDKTLRSEEFLAWLFNESKVKDSVVVNDRWGKGCRGKHGGHYTTEYGFETGEINEGEKGSASAVHPWEECRGLGRSFGYNRFETVEDYLTAAETVELLVRVVSAGGNLLLNIGPDRHGLIPPIMEERLLQVGAWLKVNGEAIYGTTAGGTACGRKPADGLYQTRKGSLVYAIQVGWRDAPLRIRGVSDVISVSMLGLDRAIDWRIDGPDLVIEPPHLTPADIPCDWAWTYRIGRRTNRNN